MQEPGNDAGEEREMIANFNDHAANERTFLAWVRTAMALVGFGLAIGHVSGRPETPVTGAVLVGAGVMVVVLAYVRMRMLGRSIDDGSTETYTEGARGAVVIAMMTAMFVLVVAFALHVV